jgi:putative ABC transport system permease protein
MKNNPPKRPLQFLRWFCREDYLDEIEGDLTELFIKQSESSLRKAKWKFAWSVFKYFRPEFMKSFKSYQPNSYGMYKSYFKIAFRNLLRKKIYSGINILGLSIGLACSFFILLWVIDETNYDRFHKDGNQIHQAWRHFNTGGQTYTMTSLPRGIADEMSAEFPEVEESVITYLNQELVVTSGDESFRESGGYVGSAFFNIFSFPFIHGKRGEGTYGNDLRCNHRKDSQKNLRR